MMMHVHLEMETLTLTQTKEHTPSNACVAASHTAAAPDKKLL